MSWLASSIHLFFGSDETGNNRGRDAKDEEGYLEFRGNAWVGRQAGRNERVVVGKLSSLPPFLVSLSIVAAGEGGGRDRAAFIWGRLEANGGRGGGTAWKEE